eukprot:CAMPEP_0117445120 /NCGR_PEP_ID=MMETSP0759-20121206/5620_1 /TAXON_ID=63605 /ORGANISM="Percolomonas cosmopolitus, Strain WS" /LENGTH=513 /DNA_ID=CAMNT_0005237263 /DNA_START=239 /DNA_END=1780 /DNA_ORIENTATION=-
MTGYCFDAVDQQNCCPEEISTPLTPAAFNMGSAGCSRGGAAGSATTHTLHELPSAWSVGVAENESSQQSSALVSELYDSSATDCFLTADDNSVDVGFFEDAMQQQHQQEFSGVTSFGYTTPMTQQLQSSPMHHHESCNDNDSEEDHCGGNSTASSMDGEEAVSECDLDHQEHAINGDSSSTIGTGGNTQNSTDPLNVEIRQNDDVASPSSLGSSEPVVFSSQKSSTFSMQTSNAMHSVETASSYNIHSPIQSKKRTWQVAFPSVQHQESSMRIQSRVGSRYQASIPPLRKRRRFSAPSSHSSKSGNAASHPQHSEDDEQFHKQLQPVFTPNVIPKKELNEYLHQAREILAKNQPAQIPEGKTAKLPHDTYHILAQHNYNHSEALKFFLCKYSEQYVDPAALDRRERHLFSCMAQKFRSRATGIRRSPNIQRMFDTKLFRPERSVGDLVHHYFQHEYVSDNDESDDEVDCFPMRSPVSHFASKSPQYTLQQQQQEEDDDNEEEAALSNQMRRPL